MGDETLSMGALSAEEREALEETGELDGEHGADEAKKAADEAAAAAKEAEEAKAAEQAKAAEDAAAAKAAEEAAKNAKQGGAEGETPAGPAQEEDDESQFVPSFKVDTARLKVIDERLTAITTEGAALRKRLDDGDITLDEFMAQNDKLSDERMDLKTEAAIQRDRQRQNEELPAQQWENDQRRFFGREDNKQFRADVDPVLFEALNAQVRLLGKKYLDEKREVSGARILAEAREAVLKRFGGDKPGGDKQAADKGGDAAAKEAARKRAEESAARRQKLPKTLADVPAADDHKDGGENDNEFAELDALLGDPERAFEAEMMLARMTPDQQRRFGTVGR